MDKVFISYSREDHHIAQEIGKMLTKHKIDHFIDCENIELGERIRSKVREEMLGCNYLIVIVTDQSLRSSWVFYEIGLADAAKMKIVPYVVDPSVQKALPGFMNNLNYATDLDQLERFIVDSPIRAGHDVGEIHLKLTRELLDSDMKFNLLHVRDGKDQVDGHGELLNEEYPFELMGRQGFHRVKIQYLSGIGFQFKCYVDHGSFPFEEVQRMLEKAGFKDVREGAGQEKRAWFLLPEFDTAKTVEGIVNNFYYPD